MESASASVPVSTDEQPISVTTTNNKNRGNKGLIEKAFFFMILPPI
jgi:hypothetical protein